MDIKNLITFIHVAELGSFTKAAEILGFSQSTVSFQIKQLETEFNVRLFDRINHTVMLTQKGREVLNYAHQVSRLTQEVTQSIQDKASISGHIRLAMAESLCSSLLYENFHLFTERYPGITLKIVTAGTEDMLRLMNHNEVDAVLTLDQHIYNSEYVIIKEEKVNAHFVAGRACPLCRQTLVSVEQLLQYPFILTEKGMSYRRLMEEKLAEMSLAVQPILEIGNTDFICPLVEQGAGIALLPDYVTEKAVKEGKLIHLPVKEFEIEVWKQLLHHRGKWVSPQMEAVLQYCVEMEFSR